MEAGEGRGAERSHPYNLQHDASGNSLRTCSPALSRARADRRWLDHLRTL